MKKKLLSALLSVAMVSTLLVGCGGAATEEAPAADAAVEEEAPAADDAAAEDAAATGTGKVYYLNFKPEVDEAWQQIAAE